MNQQHEDERSRIRTPIDRLLTGQPTCSNGGATAAGRGAGSTTGATGAAAASSSDRPAAASARA
ncbi:hypothetical protein [Streptomyces sp. NPDC002573]|uniref:hypothetical protein n=1 Tax=Streptomyces sp. NPDC002573 TaxID=3364651 RepID=UPI0036B35688